MENNTNPTETTGNPTDAPIAGSASPETTPTISPVETENPEPTTCETTENTDAPTSDGAAPNTDESSEN